MQAETAGLPEAATYLPAVHAMQSDAWSLPATSTYVPAAHSIQALSVDELMY